MAMHIDGKNRGKKNSTQRKNLAGVCVVPSIYLHFLPRTQFEGVGEAAEKNK